MAQFIVDFQAFKDEYNRYILKEMAIIPVYTDEAAHCLIKPPHALSKLSSNCRASVYYLLKNHHGIFWEDGYMNFIDAIRLLKDMTENAEKILIKGSERARFIEKVTGKPTVDFDSLQCPRAKHLPSVSSAPDCFYYRHSPTYHTYFEACSLRRVYKLKKWYLEYLKSTSVPNPSEKLEDEYDTTEEGYDVPPSGIHECLRSGPVTSESKFTRSSYR